VTTPDPHDRGLDGLLRRQMRGAEASDVCPDAETLAAWMDGGLDARAQAQVEEHAAGCARCQGLLAAIVKSEPAPMAPTTEPWWRRWSLRWLVPLTAAAAATIVWMLVPADERPGSPVEQEFTQARAEPTAPPAVNEAPAAPAPPVAGLPATEKKAAPLAPSKQEADNLTAPSPAVGTEDARRQATPAEAPPARADADRNAERAAPADEPTALAEAVRAEGERRRAEAPAGRPAAEAQAPAEQAQAAPAAGAAARAREAVADAHTLTAGIVSRDPAVRWRLAGPGVVERSTRADASWTRLDTGVAATYTAGSAPSASVCWLVGPGGVVMRTIDARTWQRVTSPTPGDIVGVDATDAITATVRTADGRAFRTANGGATWVATP